MILACLLAGCTGPQLMPTPNIYLQASANPFAEVAPPLRTNTVDVLYATDRRAIRQEDGTLAYGYARSASLAYGSGLVEIGDNISWESLVEQSLRRERSQKLPLHLRTVTEYGRFPATPLPIVRNNGHFRTAPAAQAAQDEMAEKLRQTLRERLALTSRKDAYVYIHGFTIILPTPCLSWPISGISWAARACPLFTPGRPVLGVPCAATPTIVSLESLRSFT